MNDAQNNSSAPIEPMTEAKAQQMILQNFIWPVLCCAVNGLRLSLPQVHIGELLIKTSGLFGRLVGMTVSQGSLTDVLKIRGGCINSFSEGVRSVKPIPGPMPDEERAPSSPLSS